MTTNTNEIRQFILKVCLIRGMLLNRELGNKNKALMHLYLKKVRTNLEGNPTMTVEQTASFFIRHSSEIYELIPGCNCKLHKKMMADYMRYFKLSDKLVQAS